MNNEKHREAELRRRARRNDLRLTKSRGRDPHRPDFGLFALISNENSFPVTPAGICSVHGCTLDEIEAHLDEIAGDQEANELGAVATDDAGATN